MSITFSGLNAVSSRILFTKRGPITKKPLAVLSGSNLRVISPNQIAISTGSFTSSHIGFRLDISGSTNFRNDGSFYISKIINSTTLELENASFSILDSAQTTTKIVTLVNAIRSAYNAHILAPGIHGIIDTSHLSIAQVAVDLASANILINQIWTRAQAHFNATSGIHNVADFENSDILAESVIATDLASCLLLCNSVLRAYESHRQNRPSHLEPDEINRVYVNSVSPVVGTYPSPTTGPLTWTLYDPRAGIIADDPNDVVVRVNGIPVPIDAVFGLLGAIVLSTRPANGSTIAVDYSYMNNPPTQMERLNSPEFSLNQAGNNNYAGLPGHKYRFRSVLIDPTSPIQVRSSLKPQRVGWKYKALERKYTASLNDPNTLLLNVPTNRVSFQGVDAFVTEKVVRYDPVSFPQNASDPWILEGDGTGLSLASGGHELSVFHMGTEFGLTELPPFFSHEIDLSYPSLVSAAFRVRLEDFIPDDAFTGVCFGLSDGAAAAVVGFLQTDAINLTSSIALANALKQALNSHIIEPHVHTSNDASDSIPIVDASDLGSLIILANFLEIQYNKHLNKGMLDGVHLSVDIPLLSVSPPATNLAGVMVILNEIRTNFNSHLVSSSHLQSDLNNSVSQIKQVGILTNRGYPESQHSWNCVVSDWTIYRTYRIFRDQSGNVSLYFSGVSLPVASVPLPQLPTLSSLDGKFDLLQQAFFGTIGKPSSSTSKWAFIRIDIQPLDSNQVSSNKTVLYAGTSVPEVDTISPWITIGQSGFDRIGPSGLMLDSTACAPVQNINILGKSSGPYRGFLRLEPSLTSKFTSSLEFTGKVGYYTFSVDNLASGVFIDDDKHSVHLVFIQANPSPPTILGLVNGPFTILSNDFLTVSINGGTPFDVVLDPGVGLSAAQVALNISNRGIPASDVGGVVQIQGTSSGSESLITLLGGSALVKLGFVPGTYFGLDSQPEPKISWFGEERPDHDDPRWSVSGLQSGMMLGRVLRIRDTNLTDFLTYSLEDSHVTTQVFSPSVDWKADFRLCAVSYEPGDSLAGLYFCGALLNIDEGPLGKNIEIQMTIDAAGNPFVHVVSFDASIGSMSSISQFAFGWNDFQPHSFDIFTSKQSGMIIILADGVVLGTALYANLKPGVFGSSISFGSGAPATNNIDLRSAQSSFDWSSVCIFRDSRISDPSASSNRYIGLYKGGDSTLLSSYHLAQIDWTNNHAYKIVRDPSSNVSVFIDGQAVPQISVNYDLLSLPPVSSSFLQQVSNGRPLVAFGSFNPREIDRTFWKPVNYSIGRITQSNNVVPPHQELDRGNAVASPDHLFSPDLHSHFGFNIYSGGTPTDDLLSSPTPSFTNLGEGTPPVPMSQNLESIGGLQSTFVAVDSVAAGDMVNQRGFLADYENDTENATTLSPLVTYNGTVTSLVSQTNSLVAVYNSHLSRTGSLGSLHLSTDPGTISTCSDLPTSITILNTLRTAYSAHIASNIFHIHPDTVNTVVAPSATDLDSALLLLIDLTQKFNLHQSQGMLHAAQDTFDSISSSPTLNLASTISFLNTFVTAFNAHIVQPGAHTIPDGSHNVSTPVATDLASAIILATSLRTQFSAHIVASGVHINNDVADAVTSSAPTDLNSLYICVDELALRYKTHIQKGSPGIIGVLNIHVVPDVTNTILDGLILSFLNQIEVFRQKLDTHRTHYFSGGITHIFHKFEQQSSIRPVLARYNYVARSFDWNSIFGSIVQLRSSYNEHLASNSHEVLDPINTYVGSGIVDLDSAQTALTALRSAFNAHIVGTSWHQEAPHSSYDPTPFILSSIPSDPLVLALSRMNELQAKYNSHILRSRSHAHVNQSHLVLNSPAIDLSTAIVLANAFKIQFNKHIASSVDHVSIDGINTITSPVASDIQSLGVLVSQSVIKFNAHRTQSGVHGTSVFVRLDAPSNALYQGMKFVPSIDGDSGQTFPFSDDESTFVGTLGSPTDQQMEYPAGQFPEHVVLVSSLASPFTFVNGDTMIVSVDWAAPVTIVFQSTDTSVAAVIARINGTVGIPLSFASDNGDGRVRITSPITTSSSNVQIIGGAAVAKLGFDHCQSANWKLAATDLSSVNVQLLTAGVDFLRIGTTGSGTTSLYSARTGLTDSNLYDFSITASVRVTYPGAADSGIYIGFSGNPIPGFTIAMGFDVIAGIRYVKMVDLNNNNVLFRVPFQWGDGQFHVYQIKFVQSTQSFQFIIIS